MGEIDADDHFIYYCGQESLRRNGVAIIVKNQLEHLEVDSSCTVEAWLGEF